VKIEPAGERMFAARVGSESRAGLRARRAGVVSVLLPGRSAVLARSGRMWRAIVDVTGWGPDVTVPVFLDPVRRLTSTAPASVTVIISDQIGYVDTIVRNRRSARCGRSLALDRRSAPRRRGRAGRRAARIIIGRTRASQANGSRGSLPAARLRRLSHQRGRPATPAVAYLARSMDFDLRRGAVRVP
jgi:hypothetical protein